MKWLATFLCLLAFMKPAVAEQPTIMQLPLFTICSTTDPSEPLLEKYGELPFLEGTGSIIIRNGESSLPGTFKMYLNPNDPRSYSIYFIVETEIKLYCLLMGGEDVIPVITGKKT